VRANPLAPGEARRRAAAFVEANGDPWRRWTAMGLAGEPPLAEAIAAFASQQREDGAWSGSEARSPLAATREALGLLDDLRALDRPLVERACRHLALSQRDDGSWRETDAASETEAIVTTGLLAGTLGKTRWARPGTLAAAAGFLAARWSPDRLRQDAGRTLAAYAHCFAHVDHDLADEALQWCGRELERGYRQGRFDAVRTARVFVGCEARALPGARLAAAELVEAILGGQAEDGGWPTPGDDDRRARAVRTLDALVALVRLA
jgi:hypothetical protein